MSGGKSSSPALPDYSNLAKEQGAANYQAATDQFRMNNPDVYNQYGRVNYSINPATGQSSVETNLSPEQQALYDRDVQQNKAWQDRQDQGWQRYESQMGAAGNNRQAVEDALYRRQTRTLDPMYDQQKQRLDAQLANEGLFRGSELYGKEQENYNRQRDEAYGDARDRSILLGGQEESRSAGQAQNDLQFLQNQFRYQNPIQASGVSGSSFAPTNIYGAAQDQFNANLGKYNAGQANAQNYFNLLGSLGSAAIGAF